MRMSGSRWFTPAQVFAQFSSSNDKESRDPTSPKGTKHGDKPNDSHAEAQNRREIQITEIGEVSLPPDRARVCIVCSNTKDSVDEVKASVNRRVDYVLQTLRAHHVKEYKMNTLLNRDDQAYRLDVELNVEFSDFTRCEQVCNILVEKLNETVKVSPPVLYHTPAKLESLRRQACVCAVRNAKNKALEVVQMFDQQLGPPLVIREEQHDEFLGSPVDSSTAQSQEDHSTFQEKVVMATVTATVKVFVIFEIKEKARIRKKNRTSS